MEERKFKNRYRIESARLEGYDYGKNGYYFITICTKNRIECFGEIVDSEMILNPLGQVAYDCWQQIPHHFSFVHVDEFIIMPNHVHGILEIDKSNHVETQHLASQTQTTDNISYKNKFGPQSQNISSIIRGYKIGVTKCARQQKIAFAWQPRFYDSIIRDERALHAIRRYIRENPAKWWRDRNNVANIFM